MTSVGVFNQLLEKNKAIIEVIHELSLKPDNKPHIITEGNNAFVTNYLYNLQKGSLPKLLDKNHPYAKYFMNPIKMRTDHLFSPIIFGWRYIKHITVKFFTNEHIEQCANDIISHVVNIMVRNNSYQCMLDETYLKKYNDEFEYILPILKLSEFNVIYNDYNHCLSFSCRK